MLRNLQIGSIYRNLFDDFNRDFLIPVYKNSIKAYRASGFFTLDSLILSFEGLLEYVSKGGKLKIICSPMLEQEDIERIKQGKSTAQDTALFKVLLEIDNYKAEDEIKEAKLDYLCNLIASKIIELRIVFMDDGLYHEKFGIFIDENDDKVYFNGSFNSTFRGSLINSESFLVEKSWENKDRMICDELDYFDSLWNGREPKLSVLEFDDVCKNKLFEKFRKTYSIDESAKRLIKKLAVAPREEKTLYPYQSDAINEFVNNNYHHFYEMATGTGKTFTAIRTIKRVFEDKGKVYSIVLVPQTDLQTQWISSFEKDGVKQIFSVGGNAGSNSDNNYVESLIEYKNNGGIVVLVALYDSFFEKYFSLFKNIENLMIVVDEAHNLTESNLEKMPDNCEFRLGLSATLERWSKEETAKIRTYFAGEKKPFYYGIEEAINNGFLSRYEYHIIKVYLTDEEFFDYQQKTKKLAQAMSNDDILEEDSQKLANERALVLKKASNKIQKLNDLVLSDKYSFKNSVVYCGQGKIEEESIIDSVTKLLNNNDVYACSQFTSKTENRSEVLRLFEVGYYDTLVAIKCFDEGVDVPKLDKIYIMASDGSRRQTVQRRGRVLRICKESGKTMAYIYDMVVLPPFGINEGLGVKSIIHNEFIRVLEYASLCENKDVQNTIDDILLEYGIERDMLKNENERTD